MKRWGIAFLIIIVSISFISFQLQRFSQDSSLNAWHEGLDGYIQSVRLQETTKKPIAAFFYTDWCPNCKKLREEILATPDFVKYSSEKLITVKINPEAGPMESQLAEEFGVFGYPSFFIIPADSNNTTQIRKTSQISVAAFIQQIKNALNS